MSKKRVLVSKESRYAMAVTAGVKFARKIGAKNVSVASVAVLQNVTPGLLFHIFGSHDNFVKAIVKQAKKDGKPVTLTMDEKPAKRVAVVKRAAPVKVAALLKPKIPTPAAKSGLTADQRKAKAARDKLRRAKPVVVAPLTPAGKFAALPTPFEASVAAVA